MKGLFITFEGGDGSGKSTQIELLEDYFKEIGYKVYITREPGGTKIGEEIRKVILNKEYTEMADQTEALLYAAARAQHVVEFILPKMKVNEIVICDRFVDSSLASQGYARGLGVEQIRTINAFATGGLQPDLTILLDVSPEEGIDRKSSQQNLDRLELEKKAFHQRVRDGYLMLSEAERDRILVIDGLKTIEEIHEIVIKRVTALIDLMK